MKRLSAALADAKRTHADAASKGVPFVIMPTAALGELFALAREAEGLRKRLKAAQATRSAAVAAVSLALAPPSTTKPPKRKGLFDGARRMKSSVLVSATPPKRATRGGRR